METQGMRWKVTKAVRASRLPSPSKLIMLTLADIADVGTAEIPERWTPSLTVLGDETSLGRSTVAAHLRALEGSGWIVRMRPETADALGRFERTRYKLCIPPSAGDGLPSAGDGQPSAVPGPPSAGAGHRNRSSSDLDQISSAPQAAKRGTRIPSDFTVTPEMRNWAMENVPELAGKRETEKFIDHWTAASGRNAVKRDWVAAWRNWMRMASERLPANRTGLPASTAPTPITKNEQCPEHRGQRKGRCRYCAADAKAKGTK